MATDREQHLAALNAWRARSLDDPEIAIAHVSRSTPAIAFNPHRNRLELVRGCDYRGAPSFDSGGCNCRRICGMGKGSPIRGSDRTAVNVQDCLECLRSDATHPH